MGLCDILFIKIIDELIKKSAVRTTLYGGVDSCYQIFHTGIQRLGDSDGLIYPRHRISLDPPAEDVRPHINALSDPLLSCVGSLDLSFDIYPEVHIHSIGHLYKYIGKSA